MVSSTTGQQRSDTNAGGVDVPAALARRGSGSGKDGSGKEEGQVSQALRTVYQKAVEEDIPAEMLDLLSKLD